MVGGIDFGCFLDGPVVEPENDVVVVVELRAGDRYGLVGIVGENGEGASGIKGKASNRVGIDAVLTEDPLDGVANTSPDVVCRLFLDGGVNSDAGPRRSGNSRSSLARVARDLCSPRPCPEYHPWR